MIPGVISITDHYTILGVHADATLKEIKAAFRRHAKRLHPDPAGNSERSDTPQNADHDQATFEQVLQAYRILSNPNLRRLYDEYKASHDLFKNLGSGALKGKKSKRPKLSGIFGKLEEDCDENADCEGSRLQSELVIEGESNQPAIERMGNIICSLYDKFADLGRSVSAMWGRQQQADAGMPHTETYTKYS